MPTGPASSEIRTCPCKTLPWSLSSFTAAEYGDVHSLLQKSRTRRHPQVDDNNSNSSNDAWIRRRDAAGYTPLHLAAQHNHVAATSLLLQLGAPVDGPSTPSSSSSDSTSGSTRRSGNNYQNDASDVATPLHRAAFAGATATMRVLMQHHCQLLTKDESFGDGKTPLHKAAAGGRYLAVQLILDALQERQLLWEGLCARDASQSTPLQVAEALVERQDEERDSVARWDAMAGGVADWNKCVALLRGAETKRLVGSPSTSSGAPPTSSSRRTHVPPSIGESSFVGTTRPSSSSSSSSSSDRRSQLPPLPPHLTTMEGCVDCEPSDSTNSSGMCLTASWQAAFQAALGSAVDQSLIVQTRHPTTSSPKSATQSSLSPPSSSCTQSKSPLMEPPLRIPPQLRTDLATSTTTSAASSAAVTSSASASAPGTAAPTACAVGIRCSDCHQQTISLYSAASTGRLICKSCKRKNVQ